MIGEVVAGDGDLQAGSADGGNGRSSGSQLWWHCGNDWRRFWQVLHRRLVAVTHGEVTAVVVDCPLATIGSGV